MALSQAHFGSAIRIEAGQVQRCEVPGAQGSAANGRSAVLRHPADRAHPKSSRQSVGGANLFQDVETVSKNKEVWQRKSIKR